MSGKKKIIGLIFLISISLSQQTNTINFQNVNGNFILRRAFMSPQRDETQSIFEKAFQALAVDIIKDALKKGYFFVLSLVSVHSASRNKFEKLTQLRELVEEFNKNKKLHENNPEKFQKLEAQYNQMLELHGDYTEEVGNSFVNPRNDKRDGQ